MRSTSDIGRLTRVRLVLVGLQAAVMGGIVWGAATTLMDLQAQSLTGFLHLTVSPLPAAHEGTR